MEIDKKAIEKATVRIGDYVHHTQVLTSNALNDISDANLYFKCENFQKVGAFKFRGACNAVFSLSKKQLKSGVATHSSGNHAQALALAAKLAGTKATIVMPENAPEVKRQAVRGYGADIITCKPTLYDRETTLEKFIEHGNATFIHPYNDLNVIAGQATCGREMIDEIVPDVLIAPVGGGGLLSGTCLAARYYGKNIDVYGAEPDGADDAFRSIKAGKIIPSVHPETIADGLLTSLGSHTFPIIRHHVKDIITVSEAEIISAMKLIYERLKIVIEPSASVAFAALIASRGSFSNKKVGVILSGGNIDFKSAIQLISNAN